MRLSISRVKIPSIKKTKLLMLFGNAEFIVRIIRSEGRHPVDNIFTTLVKFKAGGASSNHCVSK